MRERVLILAVLLLLASPAASQEERPLRFDGISVGQGLSQSTVQCILQDRKGFMWFGTMDGLNLYDGYRFTVFKHDPTDLGSLTNNQIQALCEDRAGRFWVGTAAGLDLFDRDSNSFLHYRHDPADPSSLSHNSVTCISWDRSGGLWVGTRDGLNRYVPSKNGDGPGAFERFVNVPGSPTTIGHNDVKCLLEDSSGVLWVGTADGLCGLDRKRESFTRFRHDPDSPGTLRARGVLALHEDRFGTLWVGTGEGLDTFLPGERLTFQHFSVGSDHPSPEGMGPVYAIQEEPSGALWVGTYGTGLFKIIPDTVAAGGPRVRSYRANPEGESAISNDAVLSLYADRSGVLWIGTSGGGLNKLNLTKGLFGHYRSFVGDPFRNDHNFVFSIFEDRTEVLWLGTRRGLCLLNRTTEQAFKPWIPPGIPGSLSRGYVRGIAEDMSGALWFAVHGSGLIRYDPATGQFESYSRRSKGQEGPGSDAAMCVIRDRKGKIWAGTIGGGVHRFDPSTGKFIAYRNSDGDAAALSSDDIRVIHEDRQGTLWMGSYGGGLIRLTWKDVEETQPVFTSFRHDPRSPSSLSSDFILSLHEDRRGTLWIGTLDGGLNRFDRERGLFSCYLEKDGLPNNTVYGILEDGSGNLWLSTNGGLSEFDPEEGIFRNFNLKDGLQSVEFNGGASYRNTGGELFFGGINGLNTVEPEKMRRSLFVPPVVITSVRRVGGDRSSRPGFRSPRYPVVPDMLEVSYQEAVLEFEFAALDYANPDKNEFAYRIDGRDRDWIPLGPMNKVTSSALAPGEYIFRVKGSNCDGIWNEQETTVRISVIPPFWKTRGFLLAAGLICAVLFALVALRRRARTVPLPEAGDIEEIFGEYGISKREQEIVRLVLRGKSNRDIERELFISLSTVKNHLYNIYQKLGVKNRYEMIILFRGDLRGGS